MLEASVLSITVHLPRTIKVLPNCFLVYRKVSQHQNLRLNYLEIINEIIFFYSFIDMLDRADSQEGRGDDGESGAGTSSSGGNKRNVVRVVEDDAGNAGDKPNKSCC